MKKQLAISIFAVVLVSTIAMLWLRVRSLEATVQALRQQLETNPRILNVSEATSNESGKSKPIFKLIETTKHNEHSSNVGVPWDIERVMIGDANKNEQMRRNAPKIETMSPEADFNEPKPQPGIIDLLNRRTDSK